eukprot:gnl/Dysnectes_brevis/2380_a2812_1004.p1 GENE.gnl/Dysnectes_brevis/2380_a2812_1004~~gnl/Dysnectes_brevis/2380_a2812_1004.p1  ORF type:complete len:347 (+),score=66.18 gnl/Dysnectes_brevis/2380_a2812_1004:541-1581(+)
MFIAFSPTKRKNSHTFKSKSKRVCYSSFPNPQQAAGSQLTLAQLAKQTKGKIQAKPLIPLTHNDSKRPLMKEIAIHKRAPDEAPIVGTSRTLEKQYFIRPTDHPSPSEVRPPTVLRDAFRLFTREWKTTRKGLKPRPAPTLEDPDPAFPPAYEKHRARLRALRFDVTVQALPADKLTVHVYEASINAAVRANDELELLALFSPLFRLYHQLGEQHQLAAHYPTMALLFALVMLGRGELPQCMRMVSDLPRSVRLSQQVQAALTILRCLAAESPLPHTLPGCQSGRVMLLVRPLALRLGQEALKDMSAVTPRPARLVPRPAARFFGPLGEELASKCEDRGVCFLLPL